MTHRTLGELIDELRSPSPAAAPPIDDDANLGWLLSRLAPGWRVLEAASLPAGPPWNRPSVLLMVTRAGQRERIPLILDEGARAVVDQQLRDVPLAGHDAASGAGAQPSPPDLAGQLSDLIHRTRRLSTEQRAARLMDWIMEQTDASRCALIPFEAGTSGPPLAFHLRGGIPGHLDPRHVPRGIVLAVARSRQPLRNHDLADDGRLSGVESTAERQQVRSYMAVPVVFRGELLAVCYLDRMEETRPFETREEMLFHAFAYEISLPLLELRNQQRRREYLALRDGLLASDPVPEALVTSPALERVLRPALRLASHPDQSLLLLGETGVGKEMIARTIHQASGRGCAPFVAVNLAALPGELFESELFGTVPGAFTGAVHRRGRIAQAHGGTLFLDEIGDLPLLRQVGLLRFLQDRRYTAVGSSHEEQADVRVLAATNRPLEQLVASGDFRADLFHRFAIALLVPPLRERRDEIRPLAEQELARRARRNGVRAPKLSSAALELLEAYSWPGNVRQLQAVMAQALLLADGTTIEPALIRALLPVDEPPPATTVPDSWADYRRWREETERAWLRSHLDPGESISAMARR